MKTVTFTRHPDKKGQLLVIFDLTDQWAVSATTPEFKTYVDQLWEKDQLGPIHGSRNEVKVDMDETKEAKTRTIIEGEEAAGRASSYVAAPV